MSFPEIECAVVVHQIVAASSMVEVNRLRRAGRIGMDGSFRRVYSDANVE